MEELTGIMLTRAEFLVGSLGAAAAAALAPLQDALDRFIALPTPEYRFDLVKTIQNNGFRTRVFSMVSQQWRSKAEVDKPVWRHWVVITEPPHSKSDICLLVISGGSTNDKPAGKVDSVVTDVASRTGAVVAEVHAVPNQPLLFSGEHTPRAEDDIIAYSWDKYLRTRDETWPLHLPMAKAAVRAMDTVSAVAPVKRFIVGGTSKRGWATWLTAAADRRVVGIVPVVIDELNVVQNAVHAYRVYGFWPPALDPYKKMGIMKWIGTPQFASLMAIEDPYAYRDRITIPKLIVNATGDQYFTPDSSQFYFPALRGEKYLRYLPNTDHSLKGATRTAAETGKAFVDSIINGVSAPRYTWDMPHDGSIRVQSSAKPIAAKLWQALNPDARDFRLETIGNGFTSTELHDEGGYAYAAKPPRPARGFLASFIELTYETQHQDRFIVTSGVRVTPDLLPYRAPVP